MLEKKATQQNKKLRILIVDDDIDDRQLIGLAFKEANLGHTIDFARSGEDLMVHLHQLQKSGKIDQLPDLILLDLNMPNKDGRVVLKEIRSDANLSKLNIMILSTTISSEDYKYISGLGVTKFITKPCGFYELVDIIREVGEELMKIYPQMKEP